MKSVDPNRLYGVINQPSADNPGDVTAWAIRGFRMDKSVDEQLAQCDQLGDYSETSQVYRMTKPEIKAMGGFTVGVTLGQLEAHALPRNFFEERAHRVRNALDRANPYFMRKTT